MTALSAKSSARHVKGSHVLFALLGFFAVVVAADTTMIYSALSTFGGVDNDNAYRDGLAYNRRIARSDEQSQTGWRANFELVSGPARIRLSMVDRDGAPVRGLKVRATMIRPATNRFDASLGLAESKPGTYEASLSGRDPGSWIADIEASKPGTDTIAYEMRRRLWLKP